MFLGRGGGGGGGGQQDEGKKGENTSPWEASVREGRREERFPTCREVESPLWLSG